MQYFKVQYLSRDDIGDDEAFKCWIDTESTWSDLFWANGKSFEAFYNLLIKSEVQEWLLLSRWLFYIIEPQLPDVSM